MSPLTRFFQSALAYKYYFLSIVLFILGIKLLLAAGSSRVPECSNIFVIEKLKQIVSANVEGVKFSANRVTSVFDVSEIEAPTNATRSCRAGITIEGSELGAVNYLVSLTAPGSNERFTLDTSLD